MRAERIGALALLAVPIAAGAVVWPLTGQWRWVVTGIIVGLTLPLLVAVVAGFFGAAEDLASGCIWFPLVVFGLGLPVGMAMWLWTGNGYWGLGGVLSPLAGLLLVGAVIMIDEG
jgi:hypothetical protein